MNEKRETELVDKEIQVYSICIDIYPYQVQKLTLRLVEYDERITRRGKLLI